MEDDNQVCIKEDSPLSSSSSSSGDTERRSTRKRHKNKRSSSSESEAESKRNKKQYFRAPFDSQHKITRSGGKYHLLLAVTGSVAVIKIRELIAELHRLSPPNRLQIKVVSTSSALHFFDPSEIDEIVYTDMDEWSMWKERGDPLRKWADTMLIAPLDANSMGKIANGICDNLVLSVIRAWDTQRPLYFAPAMNTCMWNNPLTYQHLKTLKELLLFKEISPIEKELMCGDKGYGAMASIQMIASIVASEVKNKFAVYSVS